MVVGQPSSVANWPPPPSPTPAAGMAIERADYDAGVFYEWHTHPVHQLIWSPIGSLTVTSTDRHNRVLPVFGLWLPADVAHAVRGDGGLRAYFLYFEPAACPVPWTTPTLVRMPAFLREAINRLYEGELTDEQRRRTEEVVYDVLEPVDVGPLDVPLPTDPRARDVAEALLRDPRDDRDLGAWARAVGSSARTLSRRFVAETGLSFAQWRAQVRMAVALERLSGGASVAAAARASGYTSTSAFAQAFRRVTGSTPATYLGAGSGTRPPA